MVSERNNLNLEVLDNPIWNALNTRHQSLASCDQSNLVRFYPRVMLPMAGLKNFEPDAIASFCSMLESKRRIGLCVPVAPVLPSELKLVMQFDTAQMIRERPPIEFSTQCVDRIIELENKDIEQMQALADLTRPGPFTSRTIQFGKFYGIKDGDRLVAMTGQRMSMHVDMQNENCILTEVSGVCTHPDFQGRGYAKALVHQAALQMESRGEIPFLHVLASNVSAIKTYTACGFTLRRIMQYLIVEKI